MSIPGCDEIRLSALARADGEQATVSAEAITEHLAGCAACRSEVEPLMEAMSLLDLQTRSVDSREVWPFVEQRIRDASVPVRSKRGWMLAAVLAPALLAYKLLEQFGPQQLPLAARLVPFVFAVAVFVLLIGENPFKINTELHLEGERS